MKKHLCAGLLAATLAVPVLAAQGKPAMGNPEEPLHRSAIAACIALLIGLQAYSRHVQDKREQQDHIYKK